MIAQDSLINAGPIYKKMGPNEDKILAFECKLRVLKALTKCSLKKT